MFFIPEDVELNGTGSNISDRDLPAARGSSALFFRRRSKQPETRHQDSLSVDLDQADVDAVEQPSSFACREYYAQVRQDITGRWHLWRSSMIQDE